LTTQVAPLTGRVALVTGAGRRSGLGAGIARALAAAGARVVVADLAAEPPAAVDYDDADGAEAVCQSITEAGGDACVAYGDVSEEDDAASLVAVALSYFGRLDIVVNNAAAPQGADRADIERVPVDAFDRQWQVNVRGSFLMIRAALPSMRAQHHGRIINVSSQAGRVGFAQRGAYSSSKAGILGLTRSVACDVAADGVTVNAVCPGVMETPRYQRSLERAAAAGGTAEQHGLGRPVPVGRLGLPADVGAACVYLASDAAAYVTGQSLAIDGGLYAI
jgi:NAD(P)-dependent dehydrogenase (short-subunit alcohol dehydrogenase family)